VLIETILAAFEMDEILYELKDHSAGLNCGRWHYIFSCIKRFRNKPGFILADRALVTMTTHFMRSYSLLQYLESWLGSGCVPIFNLMEDAATAEISRAQVWQWIPHPRGVLSDGCKVTKELFRTVQEEELAKIQTWDRQLGRSSSLAFWLRR
jgi:malate synthase